MRSLVTAALILSLATPVFAACEDQLGATAEYGSMLSESQTKLQQDLAALRAQYIALQKSLAKLRAEAKPVEKPAAEKPAPPEF